MDLKIAKWSDFYNVSVKLTIGRKKYNAMILIKDNMLLLQVNVTNDLHLLQNTPVFLIYLMVIYLLMMLKSRF